MLRRRRPEQRYYFPWQYRHYCLVLKYLALAYCQLSRLCLLRRRQNRH
jgi:hypothetical protein